MPSRRPFHVVHSHHLSSLSLLHRPDSLTFSIEEIVLSEAKYYIEHANEDLSVSRVHEFGL